MIFGYLIFNLLKDLKFYRLHTIFLTTSGFNLKNQINIKELHERNCIILTLFINLEKTL